MGNNASQVDTRTEESHLNSISAIRHAFGVYIDDVEARVSNNPEICVQIALYIEFILDDNTSGILSSYDEELIKKLLEGHDDLIEDFRRLYDDLMDVRREEKERKEIARIERVAEHIRACKVQSNSPLLRLPREIRDNIWSEVVSGNIVHITRDPGSTAFIYHSCVAPNGLKSSACPVGQADHAQCLISSSFDFPSYRLICKQISLELPDASFFASNALHFSDIEDAEEYLFNLKEVDRAAITHLRFSIPFAVCEEEDDTYSRFSVSNAWYSINNYFSCPWDRDSLNLHVSDDPEYLKKPWYFYYSGCYYRHNAHRLYKKWQIGFGGTSWDMDIGSLKYQGEPKMDIGIAYPTTLLPLRNTRPFRTDFTDPPKWLRPLLQFRQYTGLNLHFWDKNGIKEVPKYQDFIEELKEYIAGSPIGPWKVVEFRGREYENPDRHMLPAD